MYLAYCEACEETPESDKVEFYDFRFDYPVCLSCVEKLNLTPPEQTD